jgi:hypothetical protein
MTKQIDGVSLILAVIIIVVGIVAIPLLLLSIYDDMQRNDVRWVNATVVYKYIDHKGYMYVCTQDVGNCSVKTSAFDDKGIQCSNENNSCWEYLSSASLEEKARKFDSLQIGKNYMFEIANTGSSGLGEKPGGQGILMDIGEGA